jgi:hypothetical protein
MGVELSGRSLPRSWAERDLKVGDLRVLSDVAFRRTLRPYFDPVERLCERGFLVKTTRAPRFRGSIAGLSFAYCDFTRARTMSAN